MDNEQIRERWDSISKVLGRVIEDVEKLPHWEHDSEFSEWLESALRHAESRADALIDPA